MSRWTTGSYAYGAAVAVGVAYFLLGMPIQLSDSYGNLVQASEGTLGSLVYRQFFQEGYLRPLLWGQFRLVYDVADGRYFEWFRGLHAVQLSLLVVLFLRLFQPRTMADAAAVPVGLAALVGAHTFAGTVREAFPINTFLTIVLCCLWAADLARGDARWWRAVAVVVLFVFAALTVESGLLVAVTLVAAYLVGARGIGRAGLATVILLFAGYFVLRFAVLQVGSPGLEERASGFGFAVREPDELIALFGANRVPFYAYNVGASLLSVLFGEPRSGVWALTRRVVEGGPRAQVIVGTVNVVACTLGTLFIGWYAWMRRGDWRVARFRARDQLVLIFFAVVAANAVISYPYAKDVALSPAGAFFALAMSAATAEVVQSASAYGFVKRGLATALLVTLSSAWAIRYAGAHVGLRDAGTAQRNEWAYADMWFERNRQTIDDPKALALKDRLQQDAVQRHPAQPLLAGRWLALFRD